MYPLVSIIIPVYNREQSISFCLKSILSIDYNNFEVIVIDDGSTDKTPYLCDRISRLDARVKFLRQPNLGVSAARNLGLSIAEGDWITFVDSDDAVLSHRLDVLKSSICAEADIIMTGFAEGCIRDGIPCLKDDSRPTSIFVAQKAADYLFGDFDPYHNAAYPVWNKLFRKRIIDQYNVKFDESVSLGEDQIFLCEYLSHAKRIIYDETPSYVTIKWKGLSHLGGSLRSPSEFLYCQKKNYEALRKLKYASEIKTCYPEVYGIDRPITRILYRYTQHACLHKIRKGELKAITKNQIIPFLRSIPLSVAAKEHLDNNVLLTRKLLLYFGAEVAICWCLLYNFYSSTRASQRKNS